MKTSKKAIKMSAKKGINHFKQYASPEGSETWVPVP
jgi:hypothetical protein